MLESVLNFLFGCIHERESWPVRLRGEAVAHRSCLSCGNRRPYTLLEYRPPVNPDAGGMQAEEAT